MRSINYLVVVVLLLGAIWYLFNMVGPIEKFLCRQICTDGSRILHTLSVKHYNDLLDRQSSEQGGDEVTYFYVGDVFCIHLIFM